MSQIQIWTPAGVHRSLDTGNLVITGVQPDNAVEFRLDVIVFILVFKARHRRFTCCRCPNLNLRQLSEPEDPQVKYSLNWPDYAEISKEDFQATALAATT